MKISNKFEDLAPSHDVELGLYKEALDEAFENKKVKNIAITGSYGSGKSSLIETYKKEKKLNVIHISLSHFERDIDISLDQMVNILEGKIISERGDLGMRISKPGRVKKSAANIAARKKNKMKK